MVESTSNQVSGSQIQLIQFLNEWFSDPGNAYVTEGQGKGKPSKVVNFKIGDNTKPEQDFQKMIANLKKDNPRVQQNHIEQFRLNKITGQISGKTIPQVIGDLINPSNQQKTYGAASIQGFTKQKLKQQAEEFVAAIRRHMDAEFDAYGHNTIYALGEDKQFRFIEYNINNKTSKNTQAVEQILQQFLLNKGLQPLAKRYASRLILQSAIDPKTGNLIGVEFGKFFLTPEQINDTAKQKGVKSTDDLQKELDIINQQISISNPLNETLFNESIQEQLAYDSSDEFQEPEESDETVSEKIDQKINLSQESAVSNKTDQPDLQRMKKLLAGLESQKASGSAQKVLQQEQEDIARLQKQHNITKDLLAKEAQDIAELTKKIDDDQERLQLALDKRQKQKMISIFRDTGTYIQQKFNQAAQAAQIQEVLKNQNNVKYYTQKDILAQSMTSSFFGTALSESDKFSSILKHYGVDNAQDAILAQNADIAAFNEQIRQNAFIPEIVKARKQIDALSGKQLSLGLNPLRKMDDKIIDAIKLLYPNTTLEQLVDIQKKEIAKLQQQQEDLAQQKYEETLAKEERDREIERQKIIKEVEAEQAKQVANNKRLEEQRLMNQKLDIVANQKQISAMRKTSILNLTQIQQNYPDKTLDQIQDSQKQEIQVLEQQEAKEHELIEQALTLPDEHGRVDFDQRQQPIIPYQPPTLPSFMSYDEQSQLPVLVAPYKKPYFLQEESKESPIQQPSAFTKIEFAPKPPQPKQNELPDYLDDNNYYQHGLVFNMDLSAEVPIMTNQQQDFYQEISEQQMQPVQIDTVRVPKSANMPVVQEVFGYLTAEGKSFLEALTYELRATDNYLKELKNRTKRGQNDVDDQISIELTNNKANILKLKQSLSKPKPDGTFVLPRQKTLDKIFHVTEMAADELTKEIQITKEPITDILELNRQQIYAAGVQTEEFQERKKPELKIKENDGYVSDDFDNDLRQKDLSASQRNALKTIVKSAPLDVQIAMGKDIKNLSKPQLLDKYDKYISLHMAKIRQIHEDVAHLKSLKRSFYQQMLVKKEKKAKRAAK